LALSFSFIISAIGAPQQSLMLRDMDFRRNEVLPMIGGLVGGIVAVIAAVHGAGAWAIIVQQLVATAATTVLVLIRSPWRPHFSYSMGSLRDMAGLRSRMPRARVLWCIPG